MAIDFSLISHDIQWIHKGSSCTLLRSSMLKVSCLKIHNVRKEISSSFVTKEKKSFLTDDRKKKPYPSDQVKWQVKYQCWHIDKQTRPWSSLFDLRSCGISDSSIKCVTCLYELLYNYLWPRLLHPNSADNSRAQRDRELGPQISLPT